MKLKTHSHSGGLTRVAIIDNNGVRELSENEVKENYEIFSNVLTYGYSQLFDSGISPEILKKALPKD